MAAASQLIHHICPGSMTCLAGLDCRHQVASSAPRYFSAGKSLGPAFVPCLRAVCQREQFPTFRLQCTHFSHDQLPALLCIELSQGITQPCGSRHREGVEGVKSPLSIAQPSWEPFCQAWRVSALFLLSCLQSKQELSLAGLVTDGRTGAKLS